MDVTTIAVSQEVAIEKLNEYKSIIAERRRPEDLALQRAFRAAKKYRLIDIASVFKEIGLNELGQPKLAIAKADWDEVWFSRRTFSNTRWAERGKNRHITLPNDCLNTEAFTLRSPVPHIPPKLRPKTDLSNYHILFEVESWTRYPADPFLLKQINGWIFAIVAEWDLTPLEQQILSGFDR